MRTLNPYQMIAKQVEKRITVGIPIPLPPNVFTANADPTRPVWDKAFLRYVGTTAADALAEGFTVLVSEPQEGDVISATPTPLTPVPSSHLHLLPTVLEPIAEGRLVRDMYKTGVLPSPSVVAVALQTPDLKGNRTDADHPNPDADAPYAMVAGEGWLWLCVYASELAEYLSTRMVFQVRQDGIREMGMMVRLGDVLAVLTATPDPLVYVWADAYSPVQFRVSLYALKPV